jgi:hypothetical protein
MMVERKEDMGISVPKGAAMALHLSQEFREGEHAAIRGFLNPDQPQPRNPYDFFDGYTKHYAWDIGFQAAKREIRERRLSAEELKTAQDEGENALLRLLHQPR